MNTNNLIQLNHYRTAACPRHTGVQRAFRKSGTLYFIENAVTAVIGLCVLFSMILVVTML